MKVRFILLIIFAVIMVRTNSDAACPLANRDDISPLLHYINIYKGNHRRLVAPGLLRTPPYNAVLKLVRSEQSSSWGCTTFAVDPLILVSDAHCVLNNDGTTSKNLTAYYALNRNYAKSTRFEPKVYYVGTKNVDENPEYDCAVMYLDKPLPREVEPFEIDLGNRCDPSKPIQQLGFDVSVEKGRALLYEPDCNEHPEFANALPWKKYDTSQMIFNTCSMSEMGSGSPMFCQGDDGKRYVTGVQVFEHRPNGKVAHSDNEKVDGISPTSNAEFETNPKTPNLAAKASACYNKIMELKRKLHPNSTTQEVSL